MIFRAMPSWWRRPTFSPLASTTSRAEIVSSLESVIFCRSALVSTRDGLGADALDAGGNLVADRVDEGIVEDVELPARRLVEQTAEAGDPVLAGKGRAAQHRFGDSRLAGIARPARDR